jgi:hypothetical protein
LAKPHTTPHAPQLFTSVARTLTSQPLAAAPSQSAKPASQPPTTQRPAAHALTLAFARAQRAPHPPQLSGSDAVFTQSPAHADAPAPHEAAHAPALHTWPAAQAADAAGALHRPQFPLSVRVFTSQPLAASPSQSAKPAAHAPSRHAPASQLAAALAKRHITPHAPQLFTSVARTLTSQPLAAAPSQSAKPASQPPTTQRPAAHAFTLTRASAHAALQAPQFIGSEAVFAQPLPQVVVPTPQVAAQAPREQTCPAPHAPPQRPQLPLSPSTFTSQPLAALPSQSAKPATHAPRRHAPASQLAAALAKRHTTPHAPQLFTSVARTLTSQPLDAAPSQSAKPASQPPTTQRPAAHAFTLTRASAHAAPQPPQFIGSDAVLTQSLPQVLVPAPQVAAQAPALHTWPPPQAADDAAVLQRPQLPLSARVFTSQPLAALPSQSA